MSESREPLSFRYQQALAPLVKLSDPAGAHAAGKRLSELLTLLDFSTTLNRSLALPDTLDLVLLVAMGETKAGWAAVALRRRDGSLWPAARRGAADPSWGERAFACEGVESLERPVAPGDPDLPPPIREILEVTGAHLLVPLRKAETLIGVLLLGPAFRAVKAQRPSAGHAPAQDTGVSEPGPSAGQPAVVGGGGAGADTEGERSFIEALAISAAACIDNGRVYEELRDLNRSLSVRIYQLNSLFDITRELHRARDAATVRGVLVASAMGQLLATRCALLQPGGVVDARGIRFSLDLDVLRAQAPELVRLEEDVGVQSLPEAPLRKILETHGFERAVPLRSGSICYGVLLVGRKASGGPLGQEDVDFLRSLAAQGAATLDNLRLTREWLEKQKMEKEGALAREIQRALLPEQDPALPGWDITGINIPSLSVGGDYFDYLERPSGGLGLVIADVSGKGTGPALLMASVQASLSALAVLTDLSLDAILSRLNEQVYRSTEASKYVTVFYGCLDPERAELTYSNAGHCYPLLFRRSGEVERLTVGGPVIGLLPEIRLEVGRIRLEVGDVLVLYTDGLSETRNPAGEEFQEERIVRIARAVEARPAREIIAKLVSTVRIFAADAGLGDDLTLMVVKRL